MDSQKVIFSRAENNWYLSLKQPNILIIDSGIGGLSVYSEVKLLLPAARYFYFFDNEAFPYGNKPSQFLITRVFSIINSICRRHVLDLVIIACCTVSVIALSFLREKFIFPIVGVVPAIKSAAKITKNGVIGLLATCNTLRNRYIFNLISNYANNCCILFLGSSELVCMAENKFYGSTFSFFKLRNIFKSWLLIKNYPDTIVLGCTHFSFLFDELCVILPVNTVLLDSSKAVARHVLWLVNNVITVKHSTIVPSSNHLYCSMLTSNFDGLFSSFTKYDFCFLERLIV